jgi:hypothetical protein
MSAPMATPMSRPNDGARLEDMPSHAVDAHLASRRQVLVEQLRERLADDPDLNGDGAQFAEWLVAQYSEDLIVDLLVVAERLPAADASDWVRGKFSSEVGQFAIDLRECATKGCRHSLAQALQVAVLKAEQRLVQQLSGR